MFHLIICSAKRIIEKKKKFLLYLGKLPKNY